MLGATFSNEATEGRGVIRALLNCHRLGKKSTRGDVAGLRSTVLPRSGEFADAD
jgi:hypothetical protein